MTATRFIKRRENVAASCGDRLYRTGDWGYMLSDGRLEICGRCDSMVKIRGYSIEVQVIKIMYVLICIRTLRIEFIGEQKMCLYMLFILHYLYFRLWKQP